jgi:hypothetical protein
MTAPLTNQSDVPGKVVHLGQLRPNLQTVIQNALYKTRESALESLAVVKDGAETFEQLAFTSLKGGKAVAEKVLENAVETTEVVFAAAQKMATAKDVETAVRLQAELVEALITKSADGSQQFFEFVTQQSHSTLSGFRAAMMTLPKA